MSGLFGTLNTATSGLRAQQTALQTTSHNLANANTDGYTRQRVTMAANMPQSYAGIGQIGTGAVISGITRITDEYVNMQLQNEEAALTRYEQFSNTLGQLESMFNEPSQTGISHQLSEFFVSWNNLAANPELGTAKTMVIRQSQTFIDTINHTANKITSLNEDTMLQIKKDVLDFNSAAEQLKGINDQIFNATVKGEQPNDLFDKQDLLVGQMKTIAGIEVEKDQYGRAFISLDKQEIVTENRVNALTADPISGEISAGDETIQVETGSIKGLQEGAEVVQRKQGELNNFVKNLATAVNTIHTGDATEGEIPFFTFSEENTAGTISVNQELIADPSLLNAGADLNNPVAGDGSRAKAIFDLQHTALGNEAEAWRYDEATMSFDNDPTGTTLFNRYNEIVTDMGIEKQQADNMVANQTDLTALLSQRQASISGVDINEEVVNMIQYQSAFQANSRAISTIAEMLDTLINRTGV